MATANTTKLTFDEFREKVVSKLRDLGGSGKIDCPACNRDEWNCPGYVETPSTDWQDNPSGVIPTIPLICASCGFVIQFAASVFR